MKTTRQGLLPSKLSAARPKKLRFALFNLAGKTSTHGGDASKIHARFTEPGDVGNGNVKGNGNARCTSESMVASFVQHAR